VFGDTNGAQQKTLNLEPEMEETKQPEQTEKDPELLKLLTVAADKSPQAEAFVKRSLEDRNTRSLLKEASQKGFEQTHNKYSFSGDVKSAYILQRFRDLGIV